MPGLKQVLPDPCDVLFQIVFISASDRIMFLIFIHLICKTDDGDIIRHLLSLQQHLSHSLHYIRINGGK